MKKLLVLFAVAGSLVACNNSSETTPSADTVKVDTTPVVAPVVVDTTTPKVDTTVVKVDTSAKK